MLASQIVAAAAGGCVGLLGGLLGRNIFTRLNESAQLDQVFATSGAWKRSLALALLACAASLQLFRLSGVEPFAPLTFVACLSLSFVFSSTYVFGWLTLIARFGRGAGEAGELSLLVTVTLTGVLYVSGLLWITLLLFGGGVLLALTVFNGVWIYRLR